MDFITNPGNTMGRLTLFQQTIHTYWIVKCLLAKAMQSFPPNPARTEPKIVDLLRDIQNQLNHIKITQYQATNRISRIDHRVGRMEKQLQQLQQVDMPGSTMKDPAPVYSFDGQFVLEFCHGFQMHFCVLYGHLLIPQLVDNCVIGQLVNEAHG